jgi:DNA polymerase-3 subunit gamma/tau
MLWQILLKGLNEIRDSARPLAAAEMLLVRLCHAADLPTPDEALKALRDGANGDGPGASSIPSGAPQGGASARIASGGGSAARQIVSARLEPARPREAMPAMATPRLASFAALVALAGEKRDLMLKRQLETDVRPIRFEEGRIEIALEPSASRHLVNQLSARLQEWTGRPWMVAVAAREASVEAAGPTLREMRSAEKADAWARAGEHPAVKAALAQFSGAKITEVLPRGAMGAGSGEPAGLSVQGENDAASVTGAGAPDDDLPYQIDEDGWSPDPGLDPDG